MNGHNTNRHDRRYNGIEYHSPYNIQVGIFSVEKNARNTAATLSVPGIVPTVKKQSAKGKTFGRVVAGSAGTSSDLQGILKKVKSKGFTDAYAVSN